MSNRKTASSLPAKSLALSFATSWSAASTSFCWVNIVSLTYQRLSMVDRIFTGRCQHDDRLFVADQSPTTEGGHRLGPPDAKGMTRP
ncbi:exported protein of unknown function [Paraburkholderia kururiensis]